ncbi:MAG: hypothetical protein WC359_14340 [Dehalococcoidia bacterium]|jgi:hypothetical protein
MIDILAFGGGVGSWGYAALVAQDRIRAPWLGVIVDTGRECPSTWEYLERHRGQLPFELYVVKQPLPALWSGNGGSFLPGGFDLDGGAFLRGFCSTHWKRDVMRRELRRVKHITRYNLAYGIHAEEWKRMQKNKPRAWVQKIYPLVDLGITRNDCAMAALEMFGELPPRSRCWMCPGQQLDEWQEVAERWPDLYAQALQIDRNEARRANITLFGKDYEHPCGGECFA